MTGSSAKQIKRFLFRFILIAFIIFICDLGIGNILKFFYFRQTSGLLYRTTYAIDSTQADILVFGSSRASHHYVPEIFEDSLHGTFYNTGRDGNFILYNYAIFKAITLRYQPKLIIFDIMPEEFGEDANSYERLSSLLPYYYNHQEIKSTVAMRSPYEKLKLVSSIYPYNSILFTIGMGNLGYNRKRKPDNKGYVPICKKMATNTIDTVRPGSMNCNFGLDKNKMTALNDIITTCEQKKIKLIFVQSPIYNITQEYYANAAISELVTKYNIWYINFSNQRVFLNHTDYFADKGHLNNEGARLFSAITSHQIHNSTLLP